VGQCSSCADKQQDGLETDVDCGGPTCARCPNFDKCLVGSDCQSGVCQNSRCAAPACNDGVKNGLETDTDCGGPSCPACNTGQQCFSNSDCISGVCKNQICG
jgi:hypothetical protein